MLLKKILLISALILTVLFLYSTPLHGQIAKTLCEIRPGFHYTAMLSHFKQDKYLCTNTTQPPGTCAPGASCTSGASL